jgi:hypothetical protein
MSSTVSRWWRSSCGGGARWRGVSGRNWSTRSSPGAVLIAGLAWAERLRRGGFDGGVELAGV